MLNKLWISGDGMFGFSLQGDQTARVTLVKIAAGLAGSRHCHSHGRRQGRAGSSRAGNRRSRRQASARLRLTVTILLRQEGIAADVGRHRPCLLIDFGATVALWHLSGIVPMTRFLADN